MFLSSEILLILTAKHKLVQESIIIYIYIYIYIYSSSPFINSHYYMLAIFLFYVFIYIL
ncbi:MAG: hypothetical protein MCS20_01580 [Candidatus Phytoplasma mali]|nr:hypothetical protein [Candidatus Phytoplasma australiense]MBZ7920087.1 hypothetical protein [Candidatus Karelsulcia muelleri]MCG7202084.1 hypothetical protein [Candidatus Phytoplasma mali]MCZ8632461.1 hypothetical protein [Spiroplasma sp. Tabriz.8]